MSRSAVRGVTAFIVGLALNATAAADLPTDPGSAAATVEATAGALGALQWRFVGPMIGGRANAVVGHPEDRLTFYAGYSGGGVWRTRDAGAHWENVSDGYFATGSIGAIDISPSNPKVIYVGTGEHALRGDVSHGDGVYKSTDGGDSWVNVGLTETRQISRVVVHPKDPDTVYVGAIGHWAGPNQERGVYKSVDGGQHWRQVLFQDERSGVVDLIMDSARPDHLYAATWEVQRFPWGIRSGGPGSRIYRSRDGGEHWEDITDNAGLPNANVRERIGLALTASQPGRVYALISSDAGRGLYRSDDGGERWTLQTDDIRLFARAYYYMHMTADPSLPERVYVMSEELLRSDDGGKTFTPLETGFEDHHDLYIDPADPKRMIEGQDHGALVSLDGGKTWSSNHNQPTAQMYTLATDNRFPYWLYGSVQDWGSYKVSSRPRGSRTGVPYEQRYASIEDGYTVLDPDDPNVLFVGDHHWLHRIDQHAGNQRYISPWDELYYGWGTADQRYRFFWVFPVMRSAHDGALYVGSQYVHRSRDQGHSWKVISPDLTAAEPQTLELTPLPERDVDNGPYWGPLTRDSNGDNWNATLYTLAESPLVGGLIWTGSDDGLVHLTRDGGDSWQDVTPPQLPARTVVSRIDPSPHDPATAYLAAMRYKVDDLSPLILRTQDYGRSWSRIDQHGLAPDDFVRVVRADTERPGLLFAGTETALHYSLDDGARWRSLQLNLPRTPIHELQVKDGDLLAATHGRGYWVLDDLSVLRQLPDEGPSAIEGDHLYRPRDTHRYQPILPAAVGASPQRYGVNIHFHLASAREAVTVRILDAADRIVRTDIIERPRIGLHRIVWSNQRYPGAEELEDHPTRSRRRIGPLALPGDYRVELVLGETVLRQPFRLLPNPNVDMPHAHLEEQFEFALDIRDTVTHLNRTVLALREIRASMHARAKTHPHLTDQVAAMDRRLYAIEGQLTAYMVTYRMQYHAIAVRLDDKLYTLGERVVRGAGRPTAAQRELYKDLLTRYGEARAQLEEFVARDLSTLNTALGEARATLVKTPEHLLQR